MAVKKTTSPFKKGPVASKGGSGVFLPSIEDGKALEIVPLVTMDDMISADFHEFWDVNPFVSVVCLGDKCPGCETGNEAKFKAFLPVLTQSGDVKIFAFGISVVRGLNDIEEEVGSIKGRVIRIKRKGTGRGTKYSVINVGKSVDISKYEDTLNVEEHLGPTAKAEIQKLLESRDLLSPEKPPKADKAEEPEEDEDESGDGDSKGWDAL